MKRVFLLLSLIGMFVFASTSIVFAQASDSVTEPPKAAETVAPAANAAEVETAEAPKGFNQVLLQKFIEGDPVWMAPVLITLILGLAFCIERIISLSFASTNVKKLLSSVENKLQAGDVEGAKELCKASRSPVASIMYQGLSRTGEGIDVVEKSVIAYGSVQMGLLEKGLTWISLFIALAPMLGFLGTVIGMVGAFDAIEAAGDIQPSIVAGGIKVALLTTVFGLIVAIILQILYNFIVSRIDSIVNDMEDASISFMDMIIKYNICK